MLLAKEQRIGAAILFGIALIVWLVIAIIGTPSAGSSDSKQPKKYRTWEERKDSMRHVDSVRYAQWAAEREQRYDSFRLADAQRRSEWKRIRQEQYDSFRLADSLWRDSVGWRFVKREKKDTILDLNHCDTTELLYIRGIGSYTAKLIVRYREQLGGFYSPSQLSDSILAQWHLDTLMHYFVANPKDVQTLNVNACNTAVLQRHPYLRFEQAKAIYSLRRSKVRLTSMDDLQGLPEFSEKDLERLAPYLRFE